MLEVRGLEKQFGEIHALAGLNIQIESGEFYILLGPSGSGKTTTLRAIAGIERVDAGHIVLDGVDLTHAAVQSRDIAMVFRSFALYPHLTVFDNLAYPLRERRISKRDVRRRVNDIASLLGLEHTLTRKPETASGGEQQRIAIGRALIRQPKLLLLDEPLTNLDAKLRHDTRAELKRLHRDFGMTILYATPDELEALSMGQRIGVLQQGHIVQTGTPDQLYDQPDHVDVARMVGSPKMNLVPGIRRERADGVVLDLPFGEVGHGPWVQALNQRPTGSEVLFGFRPHDVKPVDDTSPPPHFKACIHLIEPLGDVTILDLELQDTVVKMVLPEERAFSFKVGDPLTLSLPLERSHLFDRQTGIAIR